MVPHRHNTKSIAASGCKNSLAAVVVSIAGLGLQACGSQVDNPTAQADNPTAIEIVVSDDGHGLVCGKKGFINTQGKLVIPPKLPYCRRPSYDYYEFGGAVFSANGLLPIQTNGGKWGYINAKGEMAISARFEMAEVFADNGLAVVRENDLYGYINTKGEMVIPAKFEYAHPFSRYGVAFVWNGEEAGLINTKGKIVSSPKQQDLEWGSDYNYASNGLARASVFQGGVGEYDTWGYVDINGDWVIYPDFIIADDFADNGLASVQALPYSDNRAGYINSRGKIVIPLIYRHTFSFAANGLAAVAVIVDKEGNKEEDEYEKINVIGKEKYVKWGYINEKGEIVIPPRYRYAGPFATNGLAAVEDKSGKMSYINEKGEMIISKKFDEAENFSNNGLARVKENGKYAYINNTGQIVVYIDKIEGRNVIKNAQNEIIWSEEIDPIKEVWTAKQDTASLTKGDICIYITNIGREFVNHYLNGKNVRGKYSFDRYMLDCGKESVTLMEGDKKDNFEIETIDIRKQSSITPRW